MYTQNHRRCARDYIQLNKQGIVYVLRIIKTYESGNAWQEWVEIEDHWTQDGEGGEYSQCFYLINKYEWTKRNSKENTESKEK